MDKPQCVINFANNQGRYLLGQARLRQSLIDTGFKGDFMGFNEESQIGAPSHKQSPYSFKVWAFKKAFDMGYKQVLWLDASVWAIKDVTPIFDYIEKHGHICQEAGHWLGSWINDRTLNYFELTREEAMQIPMIGNAGFLGLDITAPRSQQFFNRWFQSSEDGQFVGSWEDHRHDMSCSSAIVHQLRMERIKGDEILVYAGANDPVNNDVIFKAQGM